MSTAPHQPKRRPPQISVGFLLLIMIIFAVMSAGLLYASRVEAIQNELSVLFGRQITPDAQPNIGRLPHLVFILFTLTSPLILAGILSTGVGVYRYFGQRR